MSLMIMCESQAQGGGAVFVENRRTLFALMGAAATGLMAPRALAQSADDSGRLIPTPERNPYPYEGVSGAGAPATLADARGGWMSGLAGVRYRGARPMAYPTLPWGEAATGTAVEKGLLPPIHPLMELHLRDTQICIGGDGAY